MHAPRPLTKADHWRARWRAFRNPASGEKKAYLVRRWAELPEELKTPNQISGRYLTHCAFTLGASYCSFHCTHCYLPKNANSVPIPSLEQMREQIDANRRLQGPGAGLQITGGDVADAYWRSGRQDELVEIVRYAVRSGLIPMLFTHGQTLFEHPEFLERLVAEGGLRQLAVHIDMTQAGRKGYPIQKVTCEADLHVVRQKFTDLALEIRRRTGHLLEMAHNCTVTERNIDSVPEIIRWFLADPSRTHVWRMLSFQPEADTGRTIYSKKPITPDDVWEKICEGVGRRVPRDATIFGHPDCNSWTSLLVARPSGQHMTLTPSSKREGELFFNALDRVAGVSLVNDSSGTPMYKVLGLLSQNIGLLFRLAGSLVGKTFRREITPGMWGAILRGRVHTVGIGMHNFMGAAQVARAETDPVIKCRLDSCVFKGAVKQNGEWVAVPMCSMNERKWSEIYDERLRDPALTSQPQATSRASEG